MTKNDLKKLAQVTDRPTDRRTVTFLAYLVVASHPSVWKEAKKQLTMTRIVPSSLSPSTTFLSTVFADGQDVA